MSILIKLVIKIVQSDIDYYYTELLISFFYNFCFFFIQDISNIRINKFVKDFKFLIFELLKCLNVFFDKINIIYISLILIFTK